MYREILTVHSYSPSSFLGRSPLLGVGTRRLLQPLLHRFGIAYAIGSRLYRVPLQHRQTLSNSFSRERLMLRIRSSMSRAQ